MRSIKKHEAIYSENKRKSHANAWLFYTFFTT